MTAPARAPVAGPAVLDLTAPPRPGDEAPPPPGMVWDAASLDPDALAVTLGADVLDELSAVVAQLRRGCLPLGALRPEYLVLDEAGPVMAGVRTRLAGGPGIAVLDRLPLDAWTEDEAICVTWLLASLVAQPVAQTPDGRLVHHVRDERERPVDRTGLALGLTQERLDFHQDNSGNLLVPSATALLSVRPARAGGVTQYCTVYSLAAALADDDPVALDRLLQPYLHDRLGFAAPGEPELLRAPVLAWRGGRLGGRFSMNKIALGHRRAGQELDGEDRRALESALSTIERRRLHCSHLLARGQVLFVNNREGLHHRGPFEDGPTEEEQRHLVRIWVRPEGRPFFDG